MRADRAYLAGLGTTGVLLASALLLLAVVSTLVAFRGWPGSDVTEDIGNLVVGEPERRLAVDEGPARVAADAAPAAGAVAETPASGTPAAALESPIAAAIEVSRTPTQSSVPTRQGATVRDDVELRQGTTVQRPRDEVGDGSAASLLPQTPVSAQVQEVTSGLGDTTQGMTDGVGHTVGTLSPPLGNAVVDTGRFLAELLRSLGRPRP
jgi:hypothetical protein